MTTTTEAPPAPPPDWRVPPGWRLTPRGASYMEMHALDAWAGLGADGEPQVQRLPGFTEEQEVDLGNLLAQLDEMRAAGDLAARLERDAALREDSVLEAARHFPLTDAGNAEVFVSMFGDLVRYDHARGRWLVWDRHRYLPDADAAVNRMALSATRARLKAAVDWDADTEERKALSSHALRSESATRIDACLKIARTMLPIADDGKGWDETPWLLGVPNGVVDLRTGELRDGVPEDKITKQAGVEYDPEARAPRFRRFLREVLAPPDEPERAEEMARFVQVLAGYSLVGSPRLHVIPFLKGVGGNGKSVMLGAFARAAGDYARALEAAAIKSQKVDRHSTEVAHLELSRFAYCEELGDDKLNSNRLKHLSGSKVVTARKMHKDSTEYKPTWCMWLTTNGLPRTDDNSWGFWRRIVVIDFPNVFDPAKEPELENVIEAETQGILTGMVRGAVAYYAAGEVLPDWPQAVVEATAEYRDDIDPLEAIFTAGYLVADEEARTTTADLYAAYLAYADAVLVPVQYRYSRDGFAKALSARYTRVKKVRGSERGFRGVRVGGGTGGTDLPNPLPREISLSDLGEGAPDVPLFKPVDATWGHE